MSDNGETRKGQRTLSQDDGKPVEMTLPSGVDRDDATLLQRLTDTRADTIHLQQKQQTTLENLDSSMFLALMSGDEEYVRARMRGAKNMSEAEAHLLVKAERKAEEKHYEQEQLARANTPMNGQDRRPGGDKSKFAWYLLFAPDVMEQYEEQQDRKHQQAGRMDIFGGYMKDGVYYDAFGGRFHMATGIYQDKFGGSYDDTGYQYANGSYVTASGMFLDALANTVRLPDGDVYTFAASMKDEPKAAIARFIQEVADADKPVDMNAPEHADTIVAFKNHHALVNNLLRRIAESAGAASDSAPATDGIPAVPAAAAPVESAFVETAGQGAPEAVSGAAANMPAMAASVMPAAGEAYAVASAVAETGTDVRRTAEFQRLANSAPAAAVAMLADPAAGKPTVAHAQYAEQVHGELYGENRFDNMDTITRLEKIIGRLVEKHHEMRLGVTTQEAIEHVDNRAALQLKAALRRFAAAHEEQLNALQMDDVKMVGILTHMNAATRVIALALGEKNVQRYKRTDEGCSCRALKMDDDTMEKLQEPEPIFSFKPLEIAGYDHTGAEHSRFRSPRLAQIAQEIDAKGGLGDNFGQSSLKVDEAKIKALKIEENEPASDRLRNAADEMKAGVARFKKAFHLKM